VIRAVVGPRPLTRREMSVYLTLLHEGIDTIQNAARILNAHIRAVEIIAANPDTREPAVTVGDFIDDETTVVL